MYFLLIRNQRAMVPQLVSVVGPCPVSWRGSLWLSGAELLEVKEACLLSAHPASSAARRPICQVLSRVISWHLCSPGKSSTRLQDGQACFLSLWSASCLVLMATWSPSLASHPASHFIISMCPPGRGMVPGGPSFGATPALLN